MFKLFASGVDDLVLVSSPSNGEITAQIGARFDREIIYTNIGDVLIAVNPYKQLPNTGPEFIQMYQFSTASGGDAPPHIFKLAEDAYRRLAEDGENQCIIISGESGAGKTVSAKLIMNYVTAVSPNNSAAVASTRPSNDNSYGGGDYESTSRGPVSPPRGPPAVPGARPSPPAPGGARPVPTPGGKPLSPRGPAPVPGSRPVPTPGAKSMGGKPAPGARPMPQPGGGKPAPGGGYSMPKPAASPRRGPSDVEHIKKIILESNPLMEAFGNAKTVRNDNSSRFGKYLEIQFDDNSAPVGGIISTFLLEKTRVAYQQKGERNFHIFYQLYHGIDPQYKNDWGLNVDMNNFYYLAQSKCTTVEDVNDAADFAEVRKAMTTVGIPESVQMDIFRYLAGILHVGNVRFQGDTPAEIVNRTPVQWAAHLLGVEEQTLAHSITHRQIISGSARHTQYAVPQNPDQAASLRDALAKTLYDRIFEYLVVKVNEAMAYSGPSRVIGVLDIYGFEVFERNSFEQFCINYVNERLQQIFIDLTVRGEQREYSDEGVKWKEITFFDNKPVCDLVDGSKPPGIMKVLDDVCRSAHAVDSQTADTKFLEKLQQSLGSHELLAVGASAREFTIRHYAGEVTYSVDEFCFKNNDNLYASIVECMQTSNSDFLVSLFPENFANNKSAPTTASHKIFQSATHLVKRLSACSPHYIRCIKPNDKKQPLNFVSSRVEHQVKYLGLLENLKVKRAGYAYRHYKSVFLKRFGQILPQFPNGISDFVQFVTSNIPDIKADEFEEAKVFVKSPETIFLLEEALYKKLDPEGYKLKVKTYKENEKLAQQKAGKHSLKPKCIVM